jgi:hypothetical protein
MATAMTAPLSQVLRERKELSELMAIDAWAAFADLMQGDGQKEVDMALLKLVNEQAAGEIARDPVMLHMGVSLAKSLHDSITSLSEDSERRDVQVLVMAFIDKVYPAAGRTDLTLLARFPDMPPPPPQCRKVARGAPLSLTIPLPRATCSR